MDFIHINHDQEGMLIVAVGLWQGRLVRAQVNVLHLSHYKEHIKHSPICPI